MFRISAAAGSLLCGRRVFCGFSGGSDSLYLLLALKHVSAPFHCTLEAVHFDHGLRGEESRADAEWCRKKCRAEGIPCTVIPLAVKEKQRTGEGIEAAARRLRLEQWKELHAASPGCLVALGHNADDRRENLFLRLFRGSNATGLTSMRFFSRIGSVEFIRPLLEISKQEIEETLKAAGETWRLDSSNLQPGLYRRNALRLELLPAIDNVFPTARKGISRSISAVECDADFLERSAMEAYRRMCRDHSFAPSEWNSLHRALLCRVLRYFLSDQLGAEYIPDSLLLERFALAWNLKERGSIVFGAFELRAERVDQPKFGDPFSAFFPEELPSELRISIRADGERMIPFGRHSPVLLKKLFSDAKIKSYERDSYPVLRLPDDSILWIPGVKRSVLLPAGTGKCIRIRARKLD